MRGITLALACVVFTSIAANAQGMHPESQIKEVRQHIRKADNENITKAYEQLGKAAHEALEAPSHALEDFSVPGYYIIPEKHVKNSKSLQTDAFNAYACALYYRLSKKEEYGKKACELLDSWAEINKKFSEYDGSLVMAYSGTGLANAALLMKNQKIWKKSHKDKFANWIKTVYRVAADSIRTRTNNWADWGRYASVLSAAYLGDKNEIETNASLIRSDIEKKIANDGSMPEETRRGANGIWYTYFSLAPMTAASWIIYNESGINLFEEDFNGKTFKMALDYLLHYSINPDKWPHYDKDVNTPVHGYWPYLLFEAMKNIYKDEAYSDFCKNERPLMCDHHHFAWTFPTLMPAVIK